MSANSSGEIMKMQTGKAQSRKVPVARGKRIIAYLSPEVMVDLERIAQHYGLGHSEVIAGAVKDMAAQLFAKDRFGEYSAQYMPSSEARG